MLKILSLFLCCFLSVGSFAADLVGVTKIFKESFWSPLYEERFCGKNIERLVRRAIDRNIDLSDAQILEITDDSGWMFGMVNALQAREAGKFIVPSRKAPERVPGESNWYFHYVLLVEGTVLDYDFTNDARPRALENYLNEMFIPTSKIGSLDYKLKKMGQYKVISFPAEEYIYHLNQRSSIESLGTKSKLKDFIPTFYQR